MEEPQSLSRAWLPVGFLFPVAYALFPTRYSLKTPSSPLDLFRQLFYLARLFDHTQWEEVLVGLAELFLKSLCEVGKLSGIALHLLEISLQNGLVPFPCG